MKAPKKNRALKCDNQMSQAFGRAMKQSYKELQEMRDQAYNDGFDTGDNWETVVNTVTIIMALNKKHKFSTDRLLDVVHLANEYVRMANNGERSFMSMMEEIEEKTKIRFPEETKELVRRFGV